MRHRKGTINRVILHRMPGEPAPMKNTDYMGKSYLFAQKLDDGHRCWRLKSLVGDRSETNVAPEEVRPIFLRVLLDCLAPAEGIARLLGNVGRLKGGRLVG